MHTISHNFSTLDGSKPGLAVFSEKLEIKAIKVRRHESSVSVAYSCMLSYQMSQSVSDKCLYVNPLGFVRTMSTFVVYIAENTYCLANQFYWPLREVADNT